ncbi:MAG: hypothetical protein Q4F25_00670 [Eubacteriales bacterium]|nr:hypothetical protein [Eubacteriales bacterium]
MGRLHNWFVGEKKKISSMTPRTAAEYIWDYYKLWIIGIVCLVSLGLFVYGRVSTAMSEHWCYIMFADTRAEAGSGSKIWEDFVEYTGYDTSQKLLEFNAEAYFDYAENLGRGNRYYEMFAGFTDAGLLDAVTMETDSLTLLGASGRLLDLSRPECASIKEKYGDRFLYALPIDTEYSTEEVPVGIDISDSRIVTEYHIYDESCALGIGAFSGHIEAVEAFLDFLYAE